MPQDVVLPGGGFQNPAAPGLGRGLSALNRIVRDPASMVAGSAFLAVASDFIARQGYNSAERGVFSAPGHHLEQRIADIWDAANQANSSRYGAPGALEAARQAELALRDFGVEHWRNTGELYEHGYSIADQAPLNDLFSEQMNDVLSSGRTRTEAVELLEQYGERWGVDPSALDPETTKRILQSESPMDIAPGIEEETASPPAEGEDQVGEATEPRPEDDPLTPEQIAALVGLTYGNLRVTGDDGERQRDCRLRPYRDGCDNGLTPHHVVADRSFRYPGKGAGVYPGGVPHADGLTICVSNGTPIMNGPRRNEHGRVHFFQNAGERALGAMGNPPGTASLGNLEWNGVIAAAAVTGCDPVAMQRRLREYHQNYRPEPDSPVLHPLTRWRADPEGRTPIIGVGVPPIQSPVPPTSPL